MTTPFDESVYVSTAHHFVKSAALLFESVYSHHPEDLEFKRFRLALEEYTGEQVHDGELEGLLAACADMSTLERGNWDYDTAHDDTDRPEEEESTRDALDQEVNRCVIQMLS